MTALLEKDFSPSEFTLFSEILWKLGSGKGQYNLRENILADIAILLRADFAASYIWDSTHNLSREGVICKIDPKAMKDYECVWQFDDPITAQLRKRQKPTFVTEVMPLADLKKTPYYNEFLRAYGLYHGINIYFVRNGMDIGDLRIWHEKDADMFGEREKRILSLLEPYFTQALPTSLSSQYGLTSREQEVVRLVSKGLSDKDVANLLDISFTTLRTHLNNSMRKIGCNNRTEMALLIRH
ncbi:helix-turn-helix transcriptional regulator [Acinetobacter seifertii]|uniref:response regulator transcription factor n=1 Tax=Acinetobacter seifertii TaxID=1530123 RepID=UPI00280CCC62|nr:helix-turn-helix transcriptional regulator [Acinetobacter seifertii]MDQ9035752.1 helix-turn-helix transcriptional regulator [Acinetobacter seifertii]